jgi:hypothetical protein
MRDAAMDPTEALLVHEKVQGPGQVYDGERFLTEVDYSLKDVEEMHATNGVVHGAPEMVLGDRNIYGVLVASFDEHLARSVGARLTLRMQDGRSLVFTVAKVLGPSRFLIQGLDAFR